MAGGQSPTERSTLEEVVPAHCNVQGLCNDAVLFYGSHVAWSVLETRVNRAKTDEPIEMSFGGKTMGRIYGRANWAVAQGLHN